MFPLFGLWGGVGKVECVANKAAVSRTRGKWREGGAGMKQAPPRTAWAGPSEEVIWLLGSDWVTSLCGLRLLPPTTVSTTLPAPETVLCQVLMVDVPSLSPQGAEQLSVTQSEGAHAVEGREPKMLESVLARGGLVLVRDCVEWEGRSLLKALIKKSALCGEQVHILGCEVSEQEFREGFDSDINSRLIYHDLFRDPLNWLKTGEALPGGPLGILRAVGRRMGPGRVTIALDSLSWLLLHLPCTIVCQTLHAWLHQNSCPGGDPPVGQVQVLGLLHEDLHGPGPVGALSSLAQAEVTLDGMLGQTSAHILYRRPQQRPSHQTQWFSILPDFSMDLQRGPPLESEPHLDPHTSPVDPMTHLTFNLRLSKKEREARDSLTLPFQFSSEKQQALLCSRPNQSTGHIFYKPDAYDDLDQEDPDDDLDI